MTVESPVFTNGGILQEVKEEVGANVDENRIYSSHIEKIEKNVYRTYIDTYRDQFERKKEEYPQILQNFKIAEEGNVENGVPDKFTPLRIYSSANTSLKAKILFEIALEIFNKDSKGMEGCSLHEKPAWLRDSSMSQIHPVSGGWKETTGKDCETCAYLYDEHPLELLQEQIIGPPDECRRAAVVETEYDTEENKVVARVVIDGTSLMTGYQAVTPRVKDFWETVEITGLGLKKYEKVKENYGYDRSSSETPRYVNNIDNDFVVLYDLTIKDPRFR